MFSRLAERIIGRVIDPSNYANLIASIGAFYHADFSRVRFRTGGILPFIVPFPYAALALGRTVHVRPGYDRVLSDPHVMAEELFHVLQWQRLGRIRMIAFYPFFHLTRGYDGNPIELEAKREADRYRSSLTGVKAGRV
jgi:hypothetical protein